MNMNDFVKQQCSLESISAMIELISEDYCHNNKITYMSKYDVCLIRNQVLSGHYSLSPYFVVKLQPGDEPSIWTIKYKNIYIYIYNR